jgi:hypothetical protein
VSTPDSNQRDQDWVQRTRELLDQHAEQLDPIRVRQLIQARQRALLSMRRPPVVRWAFGLSAAAASLLLVAWLIRAPEPSIEPLAGIETPIHETITPIERALSLPDADLELIADPDEYALLQDLEFYAWLEDAEHGG